jgi:argininosuccinate lyase
LAEAEFAEIVSPEYMVFGRKGTGGPQPDEVRRMLAEEGVHAAKDAVWLDTRRGGLARAESMLGEAFAALLS